MITKLLAWAVTNTMVVSKLPLVPITNPWETKLNIRILTQHVLIHSIPVPLLMYETIWDTRQFNDPSEWPEDGSQPFVWSMGDQYVPDLLFSELPQRFADT